eukprot:265212-Amphidinium_carterae.1
MAAHIKQQDELIRKLYEEQEDCCGSKVCVDLAHLKTVTSASCSTACHGHLCMEIPRLICSSEDKLALGLLGGE